MSNELALFGSNVVETPFNWHETVAETKSLIEEDNALGKQQDEIIERRYTIRVQIGFNLIALQQEHAKKGYGDFIAFAEREFGYKSRNTIYDHIHVAERLGNLNVLLGGHSKWKSAVELARPSTSDTIIEQVLDGSIEATPDAIKQARKEEAEAKLRAKETEEKLEAKQKELDLFKESTKRKEQNREQIHTSQILAATEAEDQAKLAKDQAEKRLKTLQEQTADGLMSPETKEQLEKLQSDLVAREAELKERTSQRDSLAQLREQLVKELEEQRDANKARREQEMYEHKINDRVKKITEEWGKCSVTLLGQLPSPIESQVVTDNNWALLDHAADMTQKIFEAIRQVRITKDSVFLNSEVESNAH